MQSVFLERRHAELGAERDALRQRIAQLECALQVATVDGGDLLYRLATVLDKHHSCRRHRKKECAVRTILAEAERCGWKRE